MKLTEVEFDFAISLLPQGPSTCFPSKMTSQAPTAQITNFPHHGGSTASPSPTDRVSQFNNQSLFGQLGNAAPFSSSYTHQVPAPNASTYAVSATPHSLVSQPSKDKLKQKSTVWADTLSRGLVNLNISGRECLYLINAPASAMYFNYNVDLIWTNC